MTSVPLWVCAGLDGQPCRNHFVGSATRAKREGWTFNRDGDARCKSCSARTGVVAFDISESE